MKILNSKETKHIHKDLQEQYGYTEKLKFVFLLQEKKEKLYVFTQDLGDVDISKLRVDAMGTYFGAYFKGKLRLTIEGTQLVGSNCTKNVVEISKKQKQKWMMGESLQRDELENTAELEAGTFVIMRSGDDYLGCGKVTDEPILNYIPKTRYVHAEY